MIPVSVNLWPGAAIRCGWTAQIRNFHSYRPDDTPLALALLEGPDNAHLPLKTFFLLIESNSVQSQWETSVDLTLYKKKKFQYNLERYRPINHISTICNLMGKIMKLNLPDFDFYIALTSSCYKRAPSIIVWLDIVMSFDPQLRNYPPTKTSPCGIITSLFCWLLPCLIGHSQVVGMGEHLSPPKTDYQLLYLKRRPCSCFGW